MQIDNLVLGAGIAGLAYAYEKRNENTVIFESNSFLGGLCHSFKINEFTFDTAVHMAFDSEVSTTQNTKEYFDKTACFGHDDKPVFNFYHGLWLKHQLINNMYPLNVSDKVRLIKSFTERKENKNIKNFGEWLQAAYGEEIAKKFYYVYARKYWGIEPEEMSTAWLGVRFPASDIEKILLGAFLPDVKTAFYAKNFRYPINGGFQTFLKPLTENVSIEYNKTAVKINLKDKWVKFSDGSQYTYKRLASSIPLSELTRIIEDIPVILYEKGMSLKATKISLVSIGLNKPDIAKYLYFYIYDEDIMAARVYSPNIKSENNVPPGYSALQFEISHHADAMVSKEKIIENTIYALKKMKICNEEDILFMEYKLIPYGRPIFLQGMEKNRDDIKGYIQSYGVDLIGCFGEWDYFWSDQSYLSGKLKARIL